MGLVCGELVDLGDDGGRHGQFSEVWTCYFLASFQAEKFVRALQVSGGAEADGSVCAACIVLDIAGSS